ncbi:hypothetical protein LINGRAHAP2_LOCUS31505 [Linum grandiflorum]
MSCLGWLSPPTAKARRNSRLPKKMLMCRSPIRLGQVPNLHCYLKWMIPYYY